MPTPLSRPQLALRVVVVPVAFGAILFGCAGRLDLPFFWAMLALMLVILLGMLLTLDRGLIAERLRPAPGGRHRHIRIMMMPFALAHLAVAGLDARFGWSPVGMPLQSAGMAAAALGFGLSAWAVRVNRFFSPVVRIQTERGHHLVSGGPYALLRHPGYAGSLLTLACSGLALGSWWSVVPNLGGLAVMMYRVIIEDRYLHENLAGYVDYARRVRYRLLPGVW